MSRSKRSATSELNHDNWDQEEKQEEAGSFQVATEDEMRTRIIKRAVRRAKTSDLSGPTETSLGGSKIFAGLGFAAKTPVDSGKVKSFSFLGSSTIAAGSVSEVDKKVVGTTSTWKALSMPVNTGITLKSSESKESGVSSSTIRDANPSTFGKSLMNTESSQALPTLTNLQPSESTAMKINKSCGDSQNKSGSTSFGVPIAGASNFVQPKFLNTFSSIGLNNGDAKPKSSIPASGSPSSDKLQQSKCANTTTITCNSVPISPLNSVRSMFTPNKTGRSAKFLRDMTEINQGFVQWVKNHLAEDSTSILTRCFIDYISHVQKLFDEEKKLDLSEKESQLLKKQESVLNEIIITQNVSEATLIHHGGKIGGEPGGLASQPEILLKGVPTEAPRTVASMQSNVVPGVLNHARVLFTMESSGDTEPGAKKIDDTSVRFCKILSENARTQVIFYSDKPFKLAFTDNDELTEKDVAAFAEPSELVLAKKSRSMHVSRHSNATEMPVFSMPTTHNYSDHVAANSHVPEKPYPFGSVTTSNNVTEKPFSFGSMIANTNTTAKPFSFGSIVTGSANIAEKPSSFGSLTSSLNNGEKPFSFGSAVVNPSAAVAKEEDAEDEPPRVEFTQVVEEGAVYSKRCKVFVRKDDCKDYQDRGVGTLFLKPVEISGRTQLIVRADTSLGNLLLNTLLSPDTPIQKITSKAANTVMLMCIPTPDAKPPPRAVLLRLKTSLDADELIEKLNECK